MTNDQEYEQATMKPLASVIICTKNRAKLLPRALDSALSQTYDNMECVVIDCASTDETPDVLRQYSDKRLKVITLDKDPGREDSVIFGLKSAAGKYVTFLDDDDLYLPQKVEEQVRVFEASGHELGIVYCWGTIVNDKSGDREDIINTINGNVYLHTLNSMALCSFISLMFRKDILINENVFDKSCSFYASDWYYINKITRKYHVDFVPIRLFEIHKGTIYTRMSENSGYNRAYWADIHLRFHSLFLKDNEEGFMLYPAASKTHVYSIISSAGDLGDLSTATKSYFYGLRHYPQDYILHKRMIAAIYRIVCYRFKKCMQ